MVHFIDHTQLYIEQLKKLHFFFTCENFCENSQQMAKIKSNNKLSQQLSSLFL